MGVRERLVPTIRKSGAEIFLIQRMTAETVRPANVDWKMAHFAYSTKSSVRVHSAP